ncbi:hypothetical protein ACWGBH_12380 [Streptomyces massasporeus]
MTSPQVTLDPAGTEAPGNLAARRADLAERRGRTGRTAFHQGHRARIHSEVHDVAARAATVPTGRGVFPPFGACGMCSGIADAAAAATAAAAAVAVAVAAAIAAGTGAVVARFAELRRAGA